VGNGGGSKKKKKVIREAPEENRVSHKKIRKKRNMRYTARTVKMILEFIEQD